MEIVFSDFHKKFDIRRIEMQPKKRGNKKTKMLEELNTRKK